MFCQKCGTKAIEGASFCQKCGAKLVKDEEIQRGSEPMTKPVLKPAEMPALPVEPVSPPIETPPQPEQMPEQTPLSKVVGQQVEDHADVYNDSNASGNDTDIYALLKGNIGMCPVLKSAKRTKEGIRLYGKTYRYTVKLDKVNTAQVKIRSVLSFPISIFYWMFAGAFICTAGLLLQELVKYRDGIVLEYYHYMLFALGGLATGAVMLIHSFAGRKEKMAVTGYIREIAEPKQICLFERKRPAIFMVRTAIASALIVAGIIVLIFNFPVPLKYPNQLLFNGVPMERFLDMTQEDVEAEFEEEEEYRQQNSVTGGDVYYYRSDDGKTDLLSVVYSKKTGKVIYISFYAWDCSYNRKSLYKNRRRVDDILLGRGSMYNPNPYTSEVYGSVHTGFYYYDGVYFGDTLDVTEISAQQEFADDVHSKFTDVYVYGEGAAYDNGMIPLERKDYRISLMYSEWGDSLDVFTLSLYSDEWVEAMNATLDDASSVEIPVDSTVHFDAELYEEDHREKVFQ